MTTPPPSLPVAIPPSTSTPVGDVVTQHEGDALVTALADHFYAVACGWAMRDGNPVEALVFDRFLVAAQDAVASLDLARHTYEPQGDVVTKPENDAPDSITIILQPWVQAYIAEQMKHPAHGVTVLGNYMPTDTVEHYVEYLLAASVASRTPTPSGGTADDDTSGMMG